jgi:hypothetical protein
MADWAAAAGAAAMAAQVESADKPAMVATPWEADWQSSAALSIATTTTLR